MISVILPALVLNDDLYSQAKKAINSVKTENTEMIIVDNGSTVGKDFLEKSADIYIRYPDKIGFGPACNAGVKISHGDHILITSIDVEYLTGKPEDLLEKLPIVCPSAIDKGQTLDNTLHRDETFGATFLISREAYDLVKLPEGLYDERYEHGYYEDTDLWYRCDKLDIPLVRSGKVLVAHGQGTTNKYLGVLDKYMAENEKKFKEKWGVKEIKWRG